MFSDLQGNLKRSARPEEAPSSKSRTRAEPEEKSALRAFKPVVQREVRDCGEAYQRWSDAVWRTLRRLGVGRDLLSDATHDVFEVAFRRWDDFEGRSTRKTWVFGIAIRVAHGYRRRRFRHELPREPELMECLESSEAQWGSEPLGDPHAWTASRQASETLRQLLDGLSQRHQEVFVLVDMEGLSIVEAAEALHLNYRAASRRLDRARANFNQALRRHHAQSSGVAE